MELNCSRLKFLDDITVPSAKLSGLRPFLPASLYLACLSYTPTGMSFGPGSVARIPLGNIYITLYNL